MENVLEDKMQRDAGGRTVDLRTFTLGILLKL